MTEKSCNFHTVQISLFSPTFLWKWGPTPPLHHTQKTSDWICINFLNCTPEEIRKNEKAPPLFIVVEAYSLALRRTYDFWGSESPLATLTPTNQKQTRALQVKVWLLWTCWVGGVRTKYAFCFFYRLQHDALFWNTRTVARTLVKWRP